MHAHFPEIRKEGLAIRELTADKILAGDRRAIARAISAIENRTPQGIRLLRELFPHSGKALIVGVTGSPGAGKSTLVEKLAAEWRRDQEPVGIVAVDPTSPFSGGAILGDRIRMNSLFADEGVYIRSMATRGQLGGLALATQDAVTVLDAAGCGKILVETVGVGQDEVEIARHADVTILVLVPGMGDEVQTFKAGVMEIADIFVINKSDQAGADQVEQELRAMLSISPRRDAWEPPIVRTVATEGSGVGELRAAVSKFCEHAGRGMLKSRREARARARLLDVVRQQLLDHVLGRVSEDSLNVYTDDLAARRRDPYSIADEILRRVSSQGPGREEMKLHHVGIAVESLSAAIPVFKKILGRAPDSEETVADQKVRVAVFNLPGCRIELLEAASPDSPVARFIAKRGQGIHHLTLSAPGLAGKLRELEEGGIRLIDREARDGAGGEQIAFLHPSTTAGVLIELMEEKEG